MPFGLKNAPPTYQRVVSMAFKEYLGIFMKLFLDNFNVFNDRNTHLQKLHLCFDKCCKFGISLNPDKCMFLVYSKVILGYIVSWEGKLLNPKKIVAIVNMPQPKTPKDIQVFNEMVQFYQCFIQNFAFIMAPVTKLLWKTKTFEWIEEF
jgi:hypothetical protein